VLPLTQASVGLPQTDGVASRQFAVSLLVTIPYTAFSARAPSQGVKLLHRLKPTNLQTQRLAFPSNKTCCQSTICQYSVLTNQTPSHQLSFTLYAITSASLAQLHCYYESADSSYNIGTWFSPNGLYPSLPIFPIGLHEFSLGKTIYFHHIPTLIHHTSNILHFPILSVCCIGFP